ncbi:hypothetical protein Y032_0011g1594 [Ancylostoma ceylanicum]|uniref:Uncharacterized protein n=2 Tax=Ancylostoma ceylanicum TaxID=53326 RepID=A0A016VEW0_9BILA|nr:hypothetical protein Y032_0011g1594 [Ancylostoma ceylanicum]
MHVKFDEAIYMYYIYVGEEKRIPDSIELPDYLKNGTVYTRYLTWRPREDFFLLILDFFLEFLGRNQYLCPSPPPIVLSAHRLNNDRSDLERVRWMPPPIQENALNHSSKTTEEITIAYLATKGVLHSNFTMMPDGKVKITVLISTPKGAQYLTAWATSETGDLSRGQVVPHPRREDRRPGDRNGVALRPGAVQVANPGATRQPPDSPSDTFTRSTPSSVCFSGFHSLESIRDTLVNKGAIVPLEKNLLFFFQAINPFCWQTCYTQKSRMVCSLLRTMRMGDL